MTRAHRPAIKLPIALAAAIALPALAAGCGSSSSGATQSRGGYPSSAAAVATTQTAPPAPAGRATVVSSKSAAKLGTILAAGPKHLTVYLFEGDSGTRSACTGACAQVWPPVTTAARSAVSGAASAALLGTTTRADGTKQLTYAGHPLYYYARDGDAGDAYGQGIVGFGASWYVLAPSGEKVTKT